MCNSEEEELYKTKYQDWFKDELKSLKNLSRIKSRAKQFSLAHIKIGIRT